MDLCLNQTAVHWANLGSDGYGGTNWDDPAELACRWEAATELFADAFGEQRRSIAKVYLDVDVAPGDYLYLGTVDALTSADTPRSTKGAYKVQRFDKTPDLSGTEYVRMAWL